MNVPLPRLESKCPQHIYCYQQYSAGHRASIITSSTSCCCVGHPGCNQKQPLCVTLHYHQPRSFLAWIVFDIHKFSVILITLPEPNTRLLDMPAMENYKMFEIKTLFPRFWFHLCISLKYWQHIMSFGKSGFCSYNNPPQAFTYPCLCSSRLQTTRVSTLLP